jgi:hypothetical protein
MFSGLTPFILGGHNFLISNLFSMIVSVSNALRGGVQVFFRHQKKRNPFLGSNLFWEPKCLVIGWSTLDIEKKQLVTKLIFGPILVQKNIASPTMHFIP